MPASSGGFSVAATLGSIDVKVDLLLRVAGAEPQLVGTLDVPLATTITSSDQYGAHLLLKVNEAAMRTAIAEALRAAAAELDESDPVDNHPVD